MVPKDYVSEPLSNNIENDNSVNTTERLPVFTSNDEIILEIGQIKDVLYYEPDEETVEIVIFETFSEDDFVKICTDYSSLGISAEYAWIRYTYPEYSTVMQSLIEIKINDKTLPCDLLLIKNNNTGELKNIYFEISDFFGKWK
ncbi:MAG: hypothetical protein LBB89_05820 [Treponema sp.]|jgi:hypothetical protein|nr:hypothetical protein [Treponema sp.]